ncbi:MAG: D-galactonate dehydratase, partial [Anaerolineae bacterium]|nr:D-galactonate dehydratase [Anaerolineae bacterium]
MKITRISTVVVNARMRNWVFVKVETDTPGLIGWGEASLEWKTKAVVGAIEDMAGLLTGVNPLQIEHIWNILYRQQFFKGGVVTMSAISGIDQALHDIKAKYFNVP